MRISLKQLGKQELKPYPGRWAQAWRIAALCALATAMSMTYGIPEAVLSCYVLFFVMKSDAAETTIMALALVVLVSLILALLVGIVNLSIDSPPMRFGILVLSSLVFMFLGVASLLGPLGGIIALVIAFLLTVLAYVPTGEIATRALMYAWLMVAAPMGLLVVCSLVFGRRPKHVLLAEMARRLTLSAQYLEQSIAADALKEEVLAGIEAQQKRAQWLKLFKLVPAGWQPWFDHAVVHSYGVLFTTYAQGANLPEPYRLELAQACKAAATSLQQAQRPSRFAFQHNYSPTVSAAACSIQHDLIQLAHTKHSTPIPKEKTAFFVDDAFTNPAYLRNAIQTTMAAVLCYLIYSAIDWAGIHTALITCYIVGLSSTGETIQKMILRIIGCLVGVTLALLYLFVLVPHMSSIGSLMGVVFGVTLLAAWVVLGSERISYAGLQIAFAFLLISLQGFGPSIDFDTARDRVIGILLGNLMMYLFFSYLWPRSVCHVLDKRLQQIQQHVVKRSQSLQADQSVAATYYAAVAATEWDNAQFDYSMALLEPKNIRATPAQLQAYDRRLQQLWSQLKATAAGPS